jgi:hypothetical protein
MDEDSTVEILLNQREVNLLLKYAFPFDQEREQLNSHRDAPGTHAFKVDTFYLSILISDLVYSAKEIKDEGLLEELNRICIAMENAEQDNSMKPFLVQ